MPEISLIIPAYNEAAVIAQTVEDADDFLKTHFSSYEVIVVDDGSTDGTAFLALSKRKAKVISYLPNQGKGYAIRRGVHAAKGKYIFYMDADRAYPFSYILDGIILLKEADVVIGSRYLCAAKYNPYPFHRRILSRSFAYLVDKSLHLDVTDTQCGFKAFRSDAAKTIFSLSKVNDFSFDVEALYIARQLGYQIKELPVSMQCFGNCTKVKAIRDSAKMFQQVRNIRRRNNEGFLYQRYEQ